MRSERGFTLIELAIVLVIIGIIIGMVLKGQDLIQNARAKSFVNKNRHWETTVWIYFDRKGGFPGDSDRDGKIGDGNVCQDIVNANFANPPYTGTPGTDFDCAAGGAPAGGNTINTGSYTFYVFFGTDGGADAGKNVMILCKDSACNAFNQDELLFVEAFDTSIDGTADGSTGQVICVNTAPNTINVDQWEAVYNTAPTAATCTAGTSRALVYYFDSKR
ncbi:MAG TPA: prepilin-type N-terminal cleavage/methylation domain-containing protein [Aquifex aeolicus]|uniref:Prepilin-type N-terminal cleavage/methylation domain-containing protein n=1 Tax=Aquifex aeolicus TaxID=63363 RepID=A0A7C5QJI7_AQUAO|nr:prepilin-type N-terminal cleavage/methylation domain-containing protein [Aquifex aeolicus]